MTDFKTLVQTRRSHRKFSEKPLDGDDVRLILRAGLMAPTSKSTRAWHFIVVEDRTDLEKLSDAKDLGGAFIKDAPLAIILTASPHESDCWIEDCSIAAISMQYQAEELGIGSCWVQMDKRGLSDGTSATEVIRGILGIPDEQNVLCVIAFGFATDERKPQNEDKLKWENVHINTFQAI